MGQTKGSIEKRFIGHIKSSKNATTYLARAIAKYGSDSFDITLLEVVETKADANKAEIKHIARLSSNVSNIGYNLTLGGDGGDTFSCQTDARKAEIKADARDRILLVRPVDVKWSDTKQRENHSALMIQKHSDVDYAEKQKHIVESMHTPEARQKAADSMVAVWSDPAYKERTMAKIQETKSTPEYRKKLSDTMSKVNQRFCKETVVNGITFKSRKEAKEYFGVSDSTISRWSKQK